MTSESTVVRRSAALVSHLDRFPRTCATSGASSASSR